MKQFVDGLLWGFERGMRLVALVLVVWLLSLLLPDVQKDQILVSEATLEDLASAILMPLLVVAVVFGTIWKDK